MVVTELSAQQNGGFEVADAGSVLPAGWSLAGRQGNAAKLARDERVVAAGRASLRIEHNGPAEFTRVVQRLPADALAPAVGEAPRVRLTGYTRVQEQGAVAALWLRIDGPKGPLFVDGQGEEPAPRGAPGPDGWRRQQVELPLPSDVTEVAVGMTLRGAGAGWFDELELETVTLPKEGATAPAATRYVAAALELIETHALHARQMDWPALRKRTDAYARGATTTADVQVALRFAVRELGDRHSYLQSPGASRALEDAPVGNALTRAPLATPAGRLLDASIAYVAVPGFAGGSHADQIEYAQRLGGVIETLDRAGACGWVVDLRDNRGGNLWPMLVGLGALLGDRDLAATVYPDGSVARLWYRDGQGGFGDYVQLRLPQPYRLRAELPLAVLMGGGTASAAEVLAIGFRGRSATRSFGAPTSGATSGTRSFMLADGATLVLAVAATADAAGRVYSGPLLPDEHVAAARGSAAADAVLDAALEWLQAGACR